MTKALGVDVQWVVSDRVVAAWEDQARDVHYLGRLSSHNRKAEFSLMLGHSPEDKNDFLLLFHLPLRVRAGGTPKPIDLFLVLPVESFTPASPLGATTTAASEIPDSHLNAIKSAGLDNSANALCVQFRLKEPGYVMMPRIKIKNSLVGTPRDLLLSLKSLSEATNFDVYLKRNTYSQVALSGFGSAVLHGTARTCALRLKAMYQGRGAKQDAWELFGLDVNDVTLKSGNPLVGKAVEGNREGSAPPPYEDTMRTPTSSPEKSEQKLVASTPEEEKREEPRTPQACDRDSVSCVEATPPAAQHQPQQTSRKRPFADAESPTASDNEAEEEVRKRASKILVQLPLFGDDAAPFPASPPLIQRPHSSPPTSNYCPSGRTFSCALERSPLRQDLNTEELLREIATWLQDGWAVDSNVHRKLLLPLLALGYHARRCALNDFDLAKGWCTSLLYVRLATRAIQGAVSERQQSLYEDADVEEDMAHLVAWANGSIFRGAESVLREETALLGAAAARVGNGVSGARDEYIRQRALWVASVFVCFGTSKDVGALTERRFDIVQ